MCILVFFKVFVCVHCLNIRCVATTVYLLSAEPIHPFSYHLWTWVALLLSTVKNRHSL